MDLSYVVNLHIQFIASNLDILLFVPGLFGEPSVRLEVVWSIVLCQFSRFSSLPGFVGQSYTLYDMWDSPAAH
jgi:hypothetical protein